MSKIKCPNCGNKYKGNFCPVCSAAAPTAVQGKKKKKWLLPVIIAVVAVIAIASGGNKDKAEEPLNKATASLSQSQSQTETPAQESPELETPAPSAPASALSIEETEFYTHEGISVTATSIEKGLFGTEIKLSVSNDSDKNVSISTRLLSVNGYMLSTSGLYCDVAAGKKAMDSIELWSSELNQAGIETVAQVEFYLHVYDSDSYEDIHTSKLISLKTSAAEGFEQPVDDEGELLYDEGGIRVINKGLKDDGIWDGTLVLYVENGSSKEITVYSEDVSINGFMVDDSFWTELRPDTRSIDGLYLLSFEDAGIESISQIEQLEFALRIIDDDWDTIAKTDPIVLSFS